MLQKSSLYFMVFVLRISPSVFCTSSRASPPTVHAQSADGGRRYVAVTGEYSEGVALLYVLDQQTQHLVVYEAKGGANNSHSLKFVGARNIELDTLLDGFNDESEYSHRDLERQFIKSGHLPEDEGIKGGAKQGN